MSGYVSEITQFLRHYLTQHPEQREVARQGRALWWDRPQDPQWREAVAKGRVPTYPYYYDAAHARLDPFRRDEERPIPIV